MRGELDLVFLDIEMEGTNGMDTARALREADQSLQLVFVTGYSDYVFDGYEVGALGYLLKPAGAEELEKVLTRALTALQRQEEGALLLPQRGGVLPHPAGRHPVLPLRPGGR